MESLEQKKLDPKQAAKNELTSVFGIGAKKALYVTLNRTSFYLSCEAVLIPYGVLWMCCSELIETHNIMDLDDLRQHQNLLTAHQKIGLQFVDEFQRKIPRAEMRQMEAYLLHVAAHINAESPGSAPLDLTFCGSYRRGAQEVCTCPDLCVAAVLSRSLSAA